MITKRINDISASVIDQYRAVPYFNNRRTSVRGALPVQIGKGSPKEIHEELEYILKINRLDPNTVDIRKLMVESNLGIDCSGFAYHVLRKTNYSFPHAGGFLRKIIAKFRPVANIDVKTFAHDKNSKIVSLRDIQPGDIITMVGNGDASRNHIVVIDQIEYQNDLPATIHYVHSIAIPEDGQYGHGFHEGKIEIINVEKPLTDQVWSEQYLRNRALEMTCQLRRVMVS
jgi:cell wall-associated NlpC family hydrolase